MRQLRRVLFVTMGVLAVAFAPGCKDACDEAGDKLDECGLGDRFKDLSANDSGSGSSEAECSNRAECAAGCINDSSCGELEDAFSGQSNSVIDCMTSCN